MFLKGLIKQTIKHRSSEPVNLSNDAWSFITGSTSSTDGRWGGKEEDSVPQRVWLLSDVWINLFGAPKMCAQMSSSGSLNAKGFSMIRRDVQDGFPSSRSSSRNSVQVYIEVQPKESYDEVDLRSA